MIFSYDTMNEKIIKKRCDEMKEGNKQIVKIITSLIFGSLGSNVLSFVIGLEVLSKTNSALAFGGTQLIGPVVSLVLLPFAGAVVDRFEKKKIIFMAQVVSILMLVFYAFFIKKWFFRIDFHLFAIDCITASGYFSEYRLWSSDHSFGG